MFLYTLKKKTVGKSFNIIMHSFTLSPWCLACAHFCTICIIFLHNAAFLNLLILFSTAVFPLAVEHNNFVLELLGLCICVRQMGFCPFGVGFCPASRRGSLRGGFSPRAPLELSCLWSLCLVHLFRVFAVALAAHLESRFPRSPRQSV